MSGNSYNVLVFPCGSEVGLEIHRSLKDSTHIRLYGANSVDDHGRFVYADYIGGFPFVDSPDFISHINKAVKENKIDAVYPTMDSVAHATSLHGDQIGCRIIASPAETTETCFSKKQTYDLLGPIMPTPKVYEHPDAVETYPVFLKPDKGYGSRGIKKAFSKSQVLAHLEEFNDCLILEYLPGKEFTVDCFTDYHGELKFVGPRTRDRIANGISVNTKPLNDDGRFYEIAAAINKRLTFRGSWFFQLKENSASQLVLLEIASRLAGSSAIQRCRGINLALLSVFDAFEISVSITDGGFDIVLDRALYNRYKTSLNYENVYIDFDDTLLCDGKVNVDLIKAIYFFINSSKKVFLITKHDHDIGATLEQHRLSGLFDEIIHLKRSDAKADFMKPDGSILIDDSFAERSAVAARLGIPVFAPDAIECLIT